jgi:hypothetical protein
MCEFKSLDMLNMSNHYEKQKVVSKITVQIFLNGQATK